MEGRWHPSGRIKRLDFSGERRKQMRGDIMSVSQALYHDRGGFTIRGLWGIFKEWIFRKETLGRIRSRVL